MNGAALELILFLRRVRLIVYCSILNISHVAVLSSSGTVLFVVVVFFVCKTLCALGKLFVLSNALQVPLEFYNGYGVMSVKDITVGICPRDSWSQCWERLYVISLSGCCLCLNIPAVFYSSHGKHYNCDSCHSSLYCFSSYIPRDA